MTSTLSRAVRLRNAAVDLTTTAQTTVYTVPAGHDAVLKTVMVAQTSGHQTDITIELTDASAGATYAIVHEKAVASHDYLFLDLELNLNEGDAIKMTAETADRLHAVLSIDELFLANQA